MNKAMLIMDMPECCADCRLSDEGKFCKYENSQIFKLVENNEGFMTENIGLTKKPDWCPLREVPKRKQGSGLPQYDTDIHYEIGYNACIDEIIKYEADG